jgi:hypothetical protein
MAVDLERAGSHVDLDGTDVGEHGLGGMMDAVGTMFALCKQALVLMKMPAGDGKTTAGPTFEYVPPEQRN